MSISSKVLKYVEDNNLGRNPVAIRYILRAFEKEHTDVLSKMLTIEQFIKASGFPVDHFYVDTFYDNIDKGVPILITPDIIDWAGYKGGAKDEMHIKKQSFMKLLTRCDPTRSGYKEFGYDAYVKFRDMILVRGDIDTSLCQTLGDIDTSLCQTLGDIDTNLCLGIDEKLPQNSMTEFERDKMYPTYARPDNDKTFILISPDLLDKILMRLATTRGDEIREHFITLKNLLRVYMLYQLIFNGMAKDSSILTLQAMLEEARLARIVSEAHFAETKANHIESMTLLRSQHSETLQEVDVVNEQLEELTIRIDAKMPDIIHKPITPGLATMLVIMTNNQPGQYRAIRAQRRGLNAAIGRSIRAGYTREVLRIDNAQGAGNSWHKIQLELIARVDFLSTTCILHDDISELEFLTEVRRIEASRKEV